MNKNYCLLMFFLLFHSFLFGTANIWEYYLNTNLGNYGNYNNGTGLNGANLGTISSISDELYIDLVGIKTSQDGGDDIISARMYYRVYKQGDSPGSFIEHNLPYFSGNGAPNKEWQSIGDVDLLDGIVDMGTYNVEVYFEASGVNGAVNFNIYESNGGSNFLASFSVTGILPVELTHFSATPKGKEVALQFTTASELNNDYFEIQRAADSRNWEKIGRVDGAGTTQQQQDYHFVDERPLPGINYYRLKQVDYDGQYEYSEVLSVQLEDLGEPIEVYPNPAQEFIRFTLPVGAHTISLLDVTGQLVQRLVPGSEQIVVEMDIQDLLPATYYLMIYNSANELISSEKVIKL
jgi:hypothetical protein